jgi:DNA repair protein RecO (recombination protein O)
MLHTTGIVLRTIKYGETSVITDIFTAERGMVTFIGGSVRSARSRMPYGLFQPMNVVDLVSYWRDTPGAMHRIKEIRTAEVWQQIPFDLKRGAIALYMAEICRKCLHEGEPNPDLFDDLRHLLIHLDQTPDSVANVPLFFTLKLASHLGFLPAPPDEDPREQFFDLREGQFLPVPPAHGAYMDASLVVPLLQLMDAEVATCHQVALQRSERKAMLDKLLHFFQLHMPNFKDVHTPDVLEAVWG